MIGPEFLALLLITIITILTPGPDFLVIVKNTLVRSRRAGIYTALGVSTAIWFHIAYSITFVNYITGASDRVFEIVRILGGMYLLWLGSKALLASSNSCIRIENNEHALLGSSWQQGFINNILNPKATMFFVSVFSQIVGPDAELITQLFYGVVLTLNLRAWVLCLANNLTSNHFISIFEKHILALERTAGVTFIGFSLFIFLGIISDNL